MLSTVISPSIIFTSSLLIASPKPVPPNFRVVEASAWVKGLKSLGIASAEMPIPVSLISNWIRAESARENQYQRGLRESQEASIEAAKNDQDAYNKGAQAGSQAMADESARRQQKTEKKGIIIEAPAAVQPQQQQPRHQVKQGVISGDKDINDDF